MLTKVSLLLDGIIGASVALRAANGPGWHFELFIIAEIVDELHKRGYSIDLISSDGTRQSAKGGPFGYHQRGGFPKPVPAAAKGANGPTSILFRHPKKKLEWEIWNGVQLMGRSGGLHEFDISIVPKILADTVRTTGGSPLGHGWVSIECKHLKDASGPAEVRALIARVYDTTILHAHQRYVRPSQKPARIYPPNPTSSGDGPSAVTFHGENKNIYAALVCTKGFSSGAGVLARGYFIKQHGNILMGSKALSDFRKDIADWIDRHL